MKIKDKMTGASIKTTDKYLMVKIPIASVVKNFNSYDDRIKVKRGKRKEFANYIGVTLVESSDAYATYDDSNLTNDMLHTAFDVVLSEDIEDVYFLEEVEWMK